MMTDQHPLTDELIDELAAKFMSEPTGEQVVNRDHDMRAAADWQLKQCVAWLEGYEPEGWAAEQMKKDLRPTTQEDN